ncbi:MAG: exodeoxyribonuclease VII small subunit [Propionibacteriaceae bacterium]|jgi:exodeoxyribonuclease VII small subunit|nr:exodeoxyribonuclease VII small subunit [Propionibacteriaceae bacterium]
MPKAKHEADKEEIGYEAAREQLAEIVRQLESGEVPLSQAVELWEQAEKLAAQCQSWLDAAKTRIEEMKTPDQV